VRPARDVRAAAHAGDGDVASTSGRRAALAGAALLLGASARRAGAAEQLSELEPMDALKDKDYGKTRMK
jgi:hypothetical protein